LMAEVVAMSFRHRAVGYYTRMPQRMIARGWPERGVWQEGK
jgi:hypothetical protein